MEADLFTAAFLPAAGLAVLAGLLSFLSPCVLPIVPPYLAYMGGVTVSDLKDGRRSALLTALFFVLGLSTVFLLLGMAASALGRALLAYQDLLNTVAAVTVMVFGAHFIGVFRLPFLEREVRLDVGDRGGSAFGAYILGLAFAFGWTPCIGPQLSAILAMASQDGSLLRGAALLAFYAAGLGVPFLLLAAFFPKAQGLMGVMRRHMGRIEKIMGLFLWTIGLLMLTGGFAAMSYWLLETFPALMNLG